ncbi:MAG: PadR family transcriptional regulator [Sneathiellales bacterium]|nr:PadR family transcriptional regulator [Sneathiellales bacterium]
MSTNLREALVGLLLDKPNHAYALKQLLAPRVSSSDTVNDGVLYPLLKKLEKEGIISGKEDISPSNRKRTIYSVTDKGKDWFMKWLETDTDEDKSPSYDFFMGNPFLVKVQFFERLPKEMQKEKLTVHLNRTKEKLKKFSEIRSGMMERKAPPYRIALLELGISQQRSNERWLKEQIKILSGN